MFAVEVRANKKLKIDEGTAVSAVEAYQSLAGGANAGAVVASFAVERETQRRRVAAFQEFSNWLVPRKKALKLCADPFQATPEDLVAYHQAYWVETHGSTVLYGRKYPAPGSLEGNFSYLSGIFEAAGRTGLYNSQQNMGNPVQSKQVREYKEGLPEY